MLQERTHTRDFYRLGGLWATVPKMGGFTLLFALAALGLPGLGNFVGEFLVLLGVFQVVPVLAVIAAVGLVFAVVYALRLVQMSMFGPNEHNWSCLLYTSFVAAAYKWGQPDGQVVVLFILVTAAAEVSVGLTLLLRVYANWKTVDVDEVSTMKG